MILLFYVICFVLVVINARSSFEDVWAGSKQLSFVIQLSRSNFQIICMIDVKHATGPSD